MPSSPSPGGSGGSAGGGVRLPPPRPVATAVADLSGSSTAPVEVIMSQGRSAYREFVFSATSDRRILRFPRNNTNARLMDTFRRPSGLLGGVDLANRRIPALRAG